MTTNVTIFPVDGPAIVYLQDGSSFTVNEQQEKSFQLIDEGFCSISDAPPDQDEIPPFVQAMIEFWQEMAAKVREEIKTQPQRQFRGGATIMATFPIYGQMDKETKAGAVAKSIMAKTIQADMVGANTGIEAGSVMCYNVVAFSGYGAGVLNSASSWFTYGASSATVSHMRLTPGVAPTSPVDGDIWYDGTNLKMRVGGTTKTFTLA